MNDWHPDDLSIAEVYPLLNVGVIADWAVETLGLVESWRAEENGVVEHAELHWINGKISINVATSEQRKLTGVALRVGNKKTVDELFRRAQARKAKFSRELAESVVAYGFTALDPDGNEWWVHMDTGMLDQLRAGDT